MRFKEWLLNESKQSIIGLNYPEVIASLLHEQYDKNAFTIAKWFRDYKFSRPDPPKNWWLQVTGDYRQTPSLFDLTLLYGATKSPEEYKAALDKLELKRDEDWVYDDIYLKEQREALRRQIKARFFDDGFFKYNDIIQDITNGKLTNIAPYKKLNFWDAQHKYDSERIFDETEPLKTYRNGFKWIDAGRKCHLVGHLMKNCGSVGLMSTDDDRTLLALFDPNNKPHVVVTYSPNENRLSSEEGMASTAVKSKYHRYILDLGDFLGAELDTGRMSSKLLKMKYLLGGAVTGLKQIGGSDPYNEFFKFTMQGKEYVSDSHVVVSKEDLERAQAAIKQGEVKVSNVGPWIVRTVFSHLNQPRLANYGITYTPLQQVAA